MKTLTLKIEIQSPTLLASAPPAGNLIETLLFIPGNTLRGALAYRYLNNGGTPQDPTFQRMFVTGDARFGCARIDGSQPIPLSARSCKYDGGFKRDGEHGAMDLLFADSAERVCGCGGSIDYLHGFWNPATGKKSVPHTRIVTRTAIDPARGTAMSGQLYSQRVLEEGQKFFADITVADDLESCLATLVAKPFTAQLGKGGSRGQGWAGISREIHVKPKWERAQARFARFTKLAGRPVLAVTLLSDALFRDDYLRDVTAPSLRDLAPVDIRREDWQEPPSTAFMDTRIVHGFGGVPLRLPREPRLAVAAGSVFLFEAKPDTTPRIPTGSGTGCIGERTVEGHGEAMLWHPFHLDPEGVAS